MIIPAMACINCGSDAVHGMNLGWRVCEACKCVWDSSQSRKFIDSINDVEVTTSTIATIRARVAKLEEALRYVLEDGHLEDTNVYACVSAALDG